MRNSQQNAKTHMKLICMKIFKYYEMGLKVIKVVHDVL